MTGRAQRSLLTLVNAILEDLLNSVVVEALENVKGFVILVISERMSICAPIQGGVY